MLTVIAEIRTRPGQHHRQAVLDEFAKIIPTVLKEEGCHGYAPMVDAATSASFRATAPDSIIMVEQWETVAHLEAHLQTAHMSVERRGERGRSGNPHPYSGARGLSSGEICRVALRLPVLQLPRPGKR